MEINRLSNVSGNGVEMHCLPLLLCVRESNDVGKLNVNDFIPHRVQHQFGDRMQPKFEQDITSVSVGCFHRHIEDYGDFLGSLALGYQLYDLALPRRQFGILVCSWAPSLPLKVTIHNQIRHSRTEARPIPL